MVKYLPNLDRRFAALADPTRRAILEQLSKGEAPVSRIAAGFEMSLPAVMKHISVLEESGLLTCRKIGRVRRCRIDNKSIRETVEWLQSRHSVWETRLNALDRVLEQEAKK